MGVWRSDVAILAAGRRKQTWWEGIDGKLRRGARFDIPAEAVRAWGTDHWDGRRDTTVHAANCAVKLVLPAHMQSRVQEAYENGRFTGGSSENSA